MQRWINDNWNRWGSEGTVTDSEGRTVVDQSSLEGSHLLTRLRHTKEGRCTAGTWARFTRLALMRAGALQVDSSIAPQRLGLRT